MTEAPTKTQFTATVALHGKSATGIEVPPEAVEALGPRKNPAVVVTINGASYRSTVAKRGDRYLIPVSAENRAVVGVVADDQVEVQLTLDSQPREVTVPEDLTRALAGEPKAKQFLEGLSFSQKREYVRWIESAKREETRLARVERSVQALSEGRKQH